MDKFGSVVNLDVHGNLQPDCSADSGTRKCTTGMHKFGCVIERMNLCKHVACRCSARSSAPSACKAVHRCTCTHCCNGNYLACRCSARSSAPSACKAVHRGTCTHCCNGEYFACRCSAWSSAPLHATLCTDAPALIAAMGIILRVDAVHAHLHLLHATLCTDTPALIAAMGNVLRLN